MCGGGTGGSIEFIAFVAGSPSGSGANGETENPTGSEQTVSDTSSDTADLGDTTLAVSSDTSGIYLTVGNAVGKKISVKLGGKWLVMEPTRNSETRVWYPGTSEFLQILVYVDRVLKLDTYVKTVNANPTTSAPIEAKPSVTQSATLNPSIALKTTENSVRVEISNGTGSRLSAKIAGKWSVIEIDKALEILETEVQPGVEFSVALYIDGVLILRESVTAGVVESVKEMPIEFGSAGPDESLTSSKSGSASATTTVSSSTPVTVEVDSNGSDIAFSVLNGQGRKISVQIGGRWLVRVPTSQNYVFKSSSIQGQDVDIRIYVDGVLTGESTITVGDPGQTGFVADDSTESPSSASPGESSSSPASGTTTSPSLSFTASVSSSGSDIGVSLSGAGGQKVSLRIGGRWFVVYPSSDFEEFRTASIAGESVSIAVYINTVFWGAFNIRVAG
tara:strand:- start:162 stop:1502 length:1341 start_codon:yes stop_codon:yes gene_type:complete